MVPPDDSKELGGLARSIDSLFDEGRGTPPSGDAAPEPGIPASVSREASVAETPETDLGEPSPAEAPGESAPSEDIVWEPVEEVAPPAPRAEDADPAALELAVGAFLAAPPLSREGLGRAVRDAAGALREAAALDVLADAVERLTVEAGDPPDVACLAMAQTLLTPAVASRIVARLVGAREEERHAELITITSRLGNEMALALSDGLAATTDRHARRRMLGALVAMGPVATPVVEAMVEDSRWFVVRNAVAVLGDVGGDRAVELITSTLAHPDPRVRREALLALTKVGGDDAGMLVYGMIEDHDSGVRLAAANAAGALKVERATRPLLGLLDAETDDDVVVGVLGALGKLGDPGAVSSIEKRAVGTFLSRPPTGVRIAAYRALHKIGTPHAKGLLVRAADDKDPEVRGSVRHMLGMR